MDAMNDAVIVEAVRTPVGIGKPEKGALSGIHPVDLSAHVIDALISRVGIEPENVEDIVMETKRIGEGNVFVPPPPCNTSIHYQNSHNPHAPQAEFFDVEKGERQRRRF